MKYEFQDLFDELSGFIDYLNESTTFSERDSSLSFRENYFLERDYRDNPEYQNISIYSEDMTTMKKLEQVLTRLLSNNIKALDYNKVLSTQTTEYMKDDNSYTKDFQLDLKHNMTFTQVIKLIENEYIRDNFKGLKILKLRLVQAINTTIE